MTKCDGVKGLVLASHCTNLSGNIGGNDNAEIHQPIRFAFSNANRVVDEIIDPNLSYFSSNGCDGYPCRYSDAAFAEMRSSSNIDLGRIAKPEAVNDRDVNPVGATFSITREGTAQVGDSIYIIRRSSGWLTGEVTDMCVTSRVDGAHDGSEARILCVGEFEIDSDSDDPSGGDSGAPVMEHLSGSNVSLLGTLFSGDANDGVYYYSQVGLIYSELGEGSNLTWDSCVSGC